MIIILSKYIIDHFFFKNIFLHYEHVYDTVIFKTPQILAQEN